MSAAPSPIVTHRDVEQTIRTLFSAADNHDLVVRVQGAGDSEARNDAFAELLNSLAMYNGDALNASALVVAPPSHGSLTRALSVLGKKHLQLRLFGENFAHLRPDARRSVG